MKKSYRLIKSDYVEELHGEASCYEHEATGARVFTVKNNDKNKVFMIGFRTPPDDSTGVAHIMEHSVLCGSMKYPLKDPFVELAKGSLNTFLNAMTYPDKTVYPIASVNDRDFMNLMDVYLDSVFHPNVYREPRIFRQEGWHYEIEGLGTGSEEITLNGVVYNEMKGAFSNPDSVLERYILRTLFPDTPYAHESGGDPEVIPELTREAFLDFHRRYYHPSNSFIYLYGDMDMDEKLGWIDENYLKYYERLDIDSHIALQKPFDEPAHEEQYYAVSENESEEGGAYLSWSFCLGDSLDNERRLAWNVLEYILLSSPGAVLREALINAGIGDDISGGCCFETAQPYFSVIAKHTDPERTDEFKKVIRDTLVSLTDNGISKKSLRAALNMIEFKLREEDYGTTPAGLVRGLGFINSWLYDGDMFEYVYYNQAVSDLKSKIDTDYFENLIKDAILDNTFSAVVNIIPKRGLTRKTDEVLRERLNEYRRSLDDDAKKRLAEEMEDLKAYQSAQDTPETLAMLPVLKISDIERKTEHYEETVLKDDIIWTNADAGGIAYIKLLFDTSGFSEDEVQFTALLGDLLGELSTKKHGYQDLADEVMLKTGGIGFTAGPMTIRDETGADPGYRGIFRINLRVLQNNIHEGMELISEIINDSLLDDSDRVVKLLNQTKSQERMGIESAMHRAAVARAGSYFSDAARYDELCSGIAYYDFLNAAAELSGQPVHLGRFIKSLKKVRERLFTEERLSIYLYGGEEAFGALSAELEGFRTALCDRSRSFEEAYAEGSGFISWSRDDHAIPGRGVSAQGCLNEGFKTSSQVSYTARSGDFRSSGLTYTGALMVLRVMLNYDYLWINLRVLGGAYGCMSGFLRSGRMYLASYRDPNIKKTNDIYEALPDYLEKWEGDESSVSKYIIGAISSLDAPTTHSVKAGLRLSDYMYKLTEEERQKERNEILDCTAGDIRNTAKYIRALLGSGAICTIGNSEKLAEDAVLYKSMRELF